MVVVIEWQVVIDDKFYEMGALDKDVYESMALSTLHNLLSCESVTSTVMHA